jgi:hypothetical protein
MTALVVDYIDAGVERGRQPIAGERIVYRARADETALADHD